MNLADLGSSVLTDLPQFSPHVPKAFCFLVDEFAVKDKRTE